MTPATPALFPGFLAFKFKTGHNQVFLAQRREAIFAKVSERVESIPHIPPVEGDVALQHAAEFILKRNLLVMLLLPGDVGAHIIHLRLAAGENTVAALPCEADQARGFPLQPGGWTAFQFLHDIRHRGREGMREEQMHMILHAADDEGLAIEIREVPPR